MCRIMLVSILSLLGVTLGGSPAAAGQFNKVLTVGDKAPGWENLEGTDGKKHAIADLADKDVIVLVFTCNSCPIAVGYEDRLIAFAKAHAGSKAKVAVVAVNVNTIPDDRLPKMKERATKKGFPFLYLYDPTQKIARAYGALYTPEFFVIDKDRKIAYMGAMDDRSPPAEATVSYLDAAVAAARLGKAAATTETLARGCRIRFNREQRDDE